MDSYRSAFLKDNFVVIDKAFSRQLAADWIKNFNQLNDIDPADQSTWPDGARMYGRNQELHMKQFSPKAYEIICDFLGGEDKINTKTLNVGDGFNINANLKADEEWQGPGPDSPGYHKDGWFFKHFLDSPEQALLVLIIWSDIKPRSGGTFFVPDSVAPVAEFLYQHPEGVNHTYGWKRFAQQCGDFRELQADAGDMVILHPFMLHARSNNPSGRIRYLNNKCVTLLEPLNFCRADGAYNVVEESLRRILGPKIEDFKITSPRLRSPDMRRLEVVE